MRNTIRTFVAVEIPPEVQERAGVLISKLRPSSAKVKWVEPRDLHWTLKFLGDVDLRETPAICQAVSEAVKSLTPFDIDVVGTGAFPDVTRPRTVWIGTGEGTEPMVKLHDAIDKALASLGFRSEGRRFRPHMTIGRVRQSTPEGIGELAGLLKEHAEFDGGLSNVSEVVVFSSELGRDGPTYEPLGHAELLG